MDSQQLRAVIAAAQAGDAEAYRALLDAYGKRLYGYFLRATGKHHDAEDLLGELMLRLVARIGRYDDRGRFEPWLFRIAANMVRDRIRRAKANPPPMSLSIESESGTTHADQLVGETEEIGTGLLAGEASADLQEALEKLDVTTRQMILLRHFSQMSFREIAEVFECPLGTALAKVHRGLRRLRRWMDTGHDTDA
ncbi:MAG TPA: sigma-70 family RNA polymerase sigma factor [Phycisphaerae bacterium]|nr:sigma-70 family RNA polymerase sigma factor [Phycisphaerae bacterium]